MSLYVKCLNGDLHTLSYPAESWDSVRAQMAQRLACEPSSLVFFNEHGQEDSDAWMPSVGDVVYVVTNPPVMLLNMTAGEYIETGHHERDLSVMATRLERSALDARDRGWSRWGSDDRVIYVPSHLRDFVRSQYASVAF